MNFFSQKNMEGRSRVAPATAMRELRLVFSRNYGVGGAVSPVPNPAMRLFLILALLLAPLGALAQSTVPVLTQTLPGRSFSAGAAAVSVDLRGYFNLAGVTGTVVQFNTDKGRFDVEMLATDAPISVNNFLAYVNDGSYTNTIFHRSMDLSGAGNGIIQGGGYSYSLPLNTVTKKAPIVLEYRLPNVRGTLAMARTSVQNSATSEWFFNVNDNTTVLGSANGGGYAVFGRVIGAGMTVVDALYAVPAYYASDSFANIPLQNIQSNQTSVVLSNLLRVSSVAVVPIYPTGAGVSVLTFSVTSTNVAVCNPTISGSTLTLSPGAGGTANITVRAVDTSGVAAAGTFAVSVESGPPPVITRQPQGHTVTAGSTVVFDVEATGSQLTYQWRKRGDNIAGATSPRLVLSGAQLIDGGNYTVVVTNGSGVSVSSDAAPLLIATSTNPGRITNLSVRGTSGTGDRVLIMGFVAGGSATVGATSVLLRGVGETLASYGVTDAIADTRIALIKDGVTQAENDNWPLSLAATFTALGAFQFPAGSRDAALSAVIPAAPYTVHVAGNAGSTGSVLAEIYDANSTVTATTPRLINISARTYVSLTDNLIAGFVIGGETAKTVLIRAIGPDHAFSQYFPTAATLSDPRLLLYRLVDSVNTLVRTNENWGGDAQITNTGLAVGAFALESPAGADAMLLLTLDPGVYSAHVVGANGTAGICLVEVYEVP